MNELSAISPIDGRYRKTVAPLAEFFSEKSLMKYRTTVEIEYLIAISQSGETALRKLTENEVQTLRQLCTISEQDAEIIKQIETTGFENIQPTNHDVKAIEYYLKHRLKNTTLADCTEWIHFALTSEDINNIAYALMLSEIEKQTLPAVKALQQQIDVLAERYKSTAMLARTHGQPASPTTLGKELKIFSSRLARQIKQLENTTLLAKLNGASGNYNAHHTAYPEVNWINFSKQFIESFNKNRKIKLKPNLVTTQIEPHDSYVELFDNLRRINAIVIDFCQDMWRYVSDEWLIQKIEQSEVGSSTMPHKVNPINFENSEGNLGVANSLLMFFSTKLPISRLQRDLSDTTVHRNFGVALAHCLIGYTSALIGLKKISVNDEKIKQALENHPEIVSEGIQTILRRENVPDAYEKLKQLTRGKNLKKEEIEQFINELLVGEKVKMELRKITPSSYTGLAEKLVEVKE